MKAYALGLMIALCSLPQTAAASGDIGSKLKEYQAKAASLSAVKSVSPRPRSPQSLTGADFVIGSGAAVVLTPGARLSIGGNFSNAGTLTAGTGSAITLGGTSGQSLTGVTTFSVLMKTGGDTLTLASNITVNGALNVIAGWIYTGSGSVTFGPGATLNGQPKGGSVIGPNTWIGPGYAAPTLSISDGWNMISVPVTGTDLRKTTLFPTATSLAFAYNAGYVVKDTLVNGEGYWLRFTGAQSVQLGGGPIVSDTIPVGNGWNMIGSVSNPVAVTSISAIGTTIVSSIFGYSGSYTVADTIEPGSGYWIRVSGAGELVMSAASQNQPAPVPTTKQLASLNRLIVTDAQGRTGVLYFGKTEDPSFNIDMYTLPPVPPQGMFDTRFGSARLTEVLTDEASKRIPLTLTSASYPLTISWQIRGSQVPASLLVDGKAVTLDRSGSTSITTGSVQIELQLGTAAELPQTFALEQNYPNPFNPSTVIRYQLPVDSKVRLTVYDMLGQELETIVDRVESAGYKSVEWRPAVASGVYLYRLEASSTADPSKTFTQVRKMMLVR